MSSSAKEAILAAARRAAMARGYAGLNFRDLAEDVGIKAASIHYHFPSKAALGEAIAQRYCLDVAADLEAISTETPDPIGCLHRYPEIFRKSLLSDNRLCLCSFMAAECDTLPEAVKKAVRSFADVNVAWLARCLAAAPVPPEAAGEDRARAIYAAVVGAQLVARSRSDLPLFDTLIASYRKAGLLPA